MACLPFVLGPLLSRATNRGGPKQPATILTDLRPTAAREQKTHVNLALLVL
jgi:hypothetical protein